MKNSPKKVAILVVGYNSRSYLDDCLRSIKESSYRNWKVFFIDNGSTDNTLSYVEKNYPEVTVVANNRNLGFAAANNLAAGRAIEAGYEYIFLLNPDTVLDSKCVEHLVARAQPTVILQPLILLFNQRKTDLINTAGNVLHYLGMSYVGNYKNNFRETACATNPALASGAAMFIPAKIIQKIGLFDETYFMYHEDVDFSWRARIAGYSITLVSEALVWHKYQFSRNKKKFFYSERNRLKFIAKNYQPKTLILIAPMFLINELLVTAHSIFSGWFGYKIKANWAATVSLGETIRARKKIVRLITDRQLQRYLSSEINFTEVRIPLVGLYNNLTRGYWKVISRFI